MQFNNRTLVWQLNVNDVSKRILRIIGNANTSDGTIKKNPLMVLCVLQILRNIHGSNGTR